MDASALQTTVNNLTTQVAADQQTLENDQTALATATAELGQVTLINQLEALTSDEVTAINAALSTDPQNTSGISISIPSVAAPVADSTSEATA